MYPGKYVQALSLCPYLQRMIQPVHRVALEIHRLRTIHAANDYTDMNTASCLTTS